MYLIYEFRIQNSDMHTGKSGGQQTNCFLSPHIEAVIISSFNSYSSKVLKSRFMVTGPDSLMSPCSFLLLL